MPVLCTNRFLVDRAFRGRAFWLDCAAHGISSVTGWPLVVFTYHESERAAAVHWLSLFADIYDCKFFLNPAGNFWYAAPALDGSLWKPAFFVFLTSPSPSSPAPGQGRAHPRRFPAGPSRSKPVFFHLFRSIVLCSVAH